MSRKVEFDLGPIKDFVNALGRAAKGDFKKALETWISGLAEDFLGIVEDEIIRKNVMDSRLLLNSFHKGGDGNVWDISDGDLTLEVGTNVEYAAFVNDGHWLNPEGVETRFVPGTWNGDRFIYDPSAKTGMMLKQKFVPGAHYWESAWNILEKVFPAYAEAALDKWMKEYFGE